MLTTEAAGIAVLGRDAGGGVMATMFETTEARWFLPRDDPRTEAIRAWLLQLAVCQAGMRPHEVRTDAYLYPCSPLLGVKQRGGGGLELKVRLSTELLRPSNTIAGRLERWGKVQVPDLARLGDLSGHRWVAVAKQRWLVRLDASGSLAVSAAQSADATCSVELAYLEGWGQVTFGVEAFAPEAEASALALGLALRRVSREIPALTLDETESRGYPEWLSRTISANGRQEEVGRGSGPVTAPAGR